MSFHAGPRRGAAALGFPIAHSLSPALHQAAYDEFGLTDWSFRTVECHEVDLPSVLASLADEGLAGVALTMPLKEAVLPLLSRVDRLAAEIRSVNTVCFGGVDDQWWGTNTDVPGMVAALKSAGIVRERAATILGAGATARSAVAALAELGVTQLTVAARRVEAAQAMAWVAAPFGVEVVALDLADVDLAATNLVISALPAGAGDSVVARVPGRVDGLFHDVLYKHWPTPLATAWTTAGGRAMSGYEMLVEQAALQVQLMTGRSPDLVAMRAAGEQARL